MRGPYLITALPDDLSGLTTELFTALHRLAMRLGDPVDAQHRLLMVKDPLLVSILVTTLPDQLRMVVSRLPGTFVYGTAAMILLTEDAHNYVILETTIDHAELETIAAIGAKLPPDP